MLRYRADVKTLVFVAAYFGLTAALWALDPLALAQRFAMGETPNPPPQASAPAHLGIAVPLLVLTCWFSFFGAVATHNTVHSPVFKSRALNRVFQVVLTLTYGNPVSSFVPGHNLSHHKHTQSRRLPRPGRHRGWNTGGLRAHHEAGWLFSNWPAKDRSGAADCPAYESCSQYITQLSGLA